MIKAQDKKDDPLKSKLDQIKGKVEKITVKVDGKDVIFEGKEAERLVERFKGKRIEKRIRIIDEDGDMEEFEGDNLVINHMKNESDKADSDKKKVKVEINDGKKTVTVTTTKDGKDEVKVFEGEDADKFLKEEKSAKRIRIMEDDEDMPMPPHHGMMMRMEDEGGCCCCCCHRMHKPMHGKKMMMKMKMKNMVKDCKSMDKECKGMNKDEDKEKEKDAK
jgi:hypothetical protein